jgi:GxxExxY protein
MMDSPKVTEGAKEWTDATINELCDQVRQIGYEVHRYLGTGYLEKIYENALLHRLQKAGIRAESQVPTEVRDDDGFLLGDYKLDIVVEGVLVIELKAAKDIDDAHVAQLLGYLRATTLKHGLLINFGSFKYQIRKFKF